MRRIALPTPCDMSVSALRWACEVLGEIPQRLLVTPIDRELAERSVAALADVDVPVFTLGALERGEWILQGAKAEAWSAGI